MACGLSCNVVNLPSMCSVFQPAPPVTVSVDEIDEGLRILDEAFGFVLKTQGPKPKTNRVVVPSMD